MALIWPSKFVTNPSPLQVFSRLVHYVCAAAALYFVFELFKYMFTYKGVPQWPVVGLIVAKAAGLWLGGRGFRFVFGRE